MRYCYPAQQSAWDVLAGLASETDGADAIATTESATTDANEPLVNGGDSAPANVSAPTTALAPVNDTTAATQPIAVADTPTASQAGKPIEDIRLKFSFRFAPWKDVLDWFASQADLSLVMDAPPPGTFNYSDTKSYSPSQAIDLINSVLLTKGYTVVRRERMLLLVNLEDGVPPNLVTQVSPEDLDQRGEYELVSVLFPLNNMDPAQVEKEIAKLIGPQGSLVVIPQAKQVFVTETAGRLRTIRNILDSVEQPDTGEEEIKLFTMKHVSAEEVLVVARQLLGLGEQQNAAADGSIRFAVDGIGDKVFVTGKADVIQRFQQVQQLMDVPSDAIDGDPTILETPQLEVYSVTDADPTAVLQVMQTIMAGLPDIRLASDPQTGNLVALARPSEHATIRATLDQMQKDASQIEVLTLRYVDPQVAVVAISRLFGGGTEESPNPKAPKVEADLTTRQLLIRATEPQITQIKLLLEKMGESGDASAVDSERGNVRMLPITGAAARTVLEQMELLWPTMRSNRIKVVTPSNTIRSMRTSGDSEATNKAPGTTSEGEPTESSSTPPDNRTPDSSRQESTKKEKSATSERKHPFRFAAFDETEEDEASPTEPRKESDTATTDGSKSRMPLPDVIVAPGPDGIMIACEDTEVLDQFEALLQTLADQAVAAAPEYTVFYLKYQKAPIAAALLQQVLGAGGGEEGSGGSLMGDIASSALGDVGGGLLGGLLGLGGDSGTITTSGDVSIVPDARLNALIVQANAQDLDLIEQLLKIIDQESSPEEVQTAGKPRLIPVVNSDASDIADVVKQVFADRMQSKSTSQRQPSPEEFIRALRGGKGGGGGGSADAESKEPKMTIGVDVHSNSLIVVASEPLYAEVKQLVEQLDQARGASDETVRVIAIQDANPTIVQQALANIIGAKAKTNTTSSDGSSSRSDKSSRDSKSSSSNPAAEIQRRMEMIRAFQSQAGSSGRGGGDRSKSGGGSSRPGSGRGPQGGR